ncbi:MAG: beta-glucosidase [Planctomycetes bacterium GWF2_41_51]|nr:MAG: beta-glucosidase [Planctomycetes bacterium GWF2_41_51]HBG25891.1 beta-glucosidase [Phycisphaerales bacterium]
MSFPKNFAWGTATASYQIEGGAFEDGRGLSVWDMMCRKANAIWEGHNGDIACDHYHRYKDDVELMSRLGPNSYRFSISWPRVLPEGIGKVNQTGIDFYDKLVDELLKNNIEPFITLFHWDYPYELYCRGGWLNPQSPDWFAEYTKIVTDKLSDRVTKWITMNEPQCFVGYGHVDGIHAPGDKLGTAQLIRIGHNALLAHGKAVRTIRAYAKKTPEIGYAPVGIVKIPATDRKEDIEAAKRSMFSIEDKGYWNNTWWMDPVIFGQYPEDGLKHFEQFLPKDKNQDMDVISEKIDFLGVNIYNGRETEMGKDAKPKTAERIPGYPTTSFGWPVTPACLYWGTKFLYERYKKPVVITENGMTNNDWIMLDGKVHDPQRIDYLHKHLLELHRAIEEKIDIRGYFLWSFIDNFEWAEGFRQRFGIVYTDYKTLQRTPKDSAYWYKNVAESNGEYLFNK